MHDNIKYKKYKIGNYRTGKRNVFKGPWPEQGFCRCFADGVKTGLSSDASRLIMHKRLNPRDSTAIEILA
jgi:hypothetical protein